MVTRQQRKSKLDPYLEKVGVVPDAKIAALAGVTADAVRNFRKRRGIPASWRGEAEPLVEVPAALVTAEPAVAPEPEKAPRKRRVSKPKKKKPAKTPRVKKPKAESAPEVAPDAAVVPEEVPEIEAPSAPAVVAVPEPEQSVEPEAVAEPAADLPAAPAPRARSIRQHRKSKLDAYLDKLGLIPDKQLANLAGVTSENVRTYRTRRGIPARWRREDEVNPTGNVPAAKAAAKPVKGRVKATPRGGVRRGKLTPFMDKIGTVPDARIAELSGTTPANVRAFRLRHDIPARWRGEGAPLASSVAAAPPAVVEVPVIPAAQLKELPAEVEGAASQAAPAGAALPGAYMVTVEGPSGTVEYAAVGTDIVDAAATAVAGMARAGITGKVVAVRFLAAVLGR